MNPVMILGAVAALMLTVFAIYKAAGSPEPRLDIQSPAEPAMPLRVIPKPVTVGTIALGVFLGQILFALVAAVVYAFIYLINSI
jgi:hypothetical protein